MYTCSVHCSFKNISFNKQQPKLARCKLVLFSHSRSSEKMYFQILTIIFVFSNQLIPSKCDDFLNLDLNINYTQLMVLLSKVPRGECVEHLMVVGNALANRNQTALKMLDASAKPQAGLLFGNFMHVGNYDECLEIDERISRHRIQGKYCSAIFQPHPDYGQELNKLLIGIMGNLGMTDRSPSPTEKAKLSYGFCVPKACTAEDLQNLTDLVEHEAQLPVHFTFLEQYCDGGEGREFTKSAIFAAVVFSIFGLLLVLGTLYEYFGHRNSDEPGTPNLLMAFSVISNGKGLLSTSTAEGNLNCLNGLRVISMMWVVLAHGYMLSLFTPHINVQSIVDWQSESRNFLMMAAPMAVDTFFVVSGLLLVYLFMKHQAKGVKFSLPMFYIHRILRLTPSLAMVVFFTTTLVVHMGRGPFWPMIEELLQKPCEKNWWATLTYIQAYMSPDDQCIAQAWYLAVDTQMYFISPLILFPLLKWPRPTIGAIVVFVVLNCSYVFEITWKKHLGTTFITLGEAEYNYLYNPTHIRGTAYLIGMLCGYFVFKTRTSTVVKLTKHTVIFLWIVSLSIMIGIAIAHYNLSSASKYNVWDASIFNSLIRVGWSLALSIIILLCVNDYGGPINSFLSSDIFNVLIRLNYSVYLLHMNVLSVVVAQGRTPTYFSNLNIFHQFWGDYVFVLGASVIWTLAFESPLLVIQKILFEKKKDPIKTNHGNTLSNGVLREGY